MKSILLAFALVLVLLPQPVLAQERVDLAITAPEAGQIVQGLAIVTGTVTVLGFSSYELSFAYLDDPTGTWFTLQSSSLPVFEGELGAWDTTTLTDGDYSLRLRAFLLDGSVQETTVTDLRVRNYTAVPTPTATVTATAFAQIVPPTAQLLAPEIATATSVHPAPTPFPPNPAGLAIPSISLALGRGAILALLLILGVGFILRLRRE
ncbi:MAG: hypothetical protein JW963_04505 [Anaerolineales bacterium]|nr:hypothetical protein [Anaerolineales bacterium]